MSDKIQYYGIDEDARDFLGGNGGGGGGPFLMEDAEDARRIADTSFDPSGYTWDLAVDSSVAGGANGDGTSGIDVNPTADGGKTPDIVNMHNKVFLVSIGLQPPTEELITIVGTTQIHFASYSGANVEYTFTPTANTEQPLEDGDAWVRVGTHFEPKQVATLGTDGKVAPEQLPPITSDFKMEDASDASRYPDGLVDPLGYSFFYTYGSLNSTEIRQHSTTSLYSRAEDREGKTVPITALNGELVDIFFDDVLHLRTTLTMTNSSTSPVYSWSGLTFPLPIEEGAVFKIVPVNASYAPLTQGDAWVHDGVEFKPAQVALKSELGSVGAAFLMEDASDAERSFISGTRIVRTTDLGNSTAGGMSYGGSNPNWILINKLDVNGVLLDYSALDDVECNIYINGSDTPTVATIQVHPEAGPDRLYFSWTGMPRQITDVDCAPVNAVRVPLENGDSWVHDGTNFVPAQVATLGEDGIVLPEQLPEQVGNEFLMEDASDAERNSSVVGVPVEGYLYNMGDYLNVGEASHSIYGSDELYINTVDSLGNTFILDEMQGPLTITYSNGTVFNVTPTKAVVKGQHFSLDWAGLSAGGLVGVTTVRIELVGVGTLPLVDGDAWVYSESKFKPAQVALKSDVVGATDTFTTNDGKTVTVVNGLITTIV